MTSIKAAPADRFSRILGVGGYRPSRVVSNEEMCTMVDSTPQWIEQRTGIVERRWATDDETLEFMCIAASRKAIAMAGIEPNQIGAVILASVSHFKQTPALAPHLAKLIGATGAAAYDISAACAGFCYALTQADSLVRTRCADYVVVIGAERLSDMLDVTDRGIGFLLADGAGAVVVGPSETAGIGPAVWGSDAGPADDDYWHVIENDLDLIGAIREQTQPSIRMEGNKVFKWAITKIARKAAEAITAAGLTSQDLDVFIPHQANNRIIDSMLKHLSLTDNVTVARDIRELGNTSSASIPLAMEAMLESGRATSGQLALVIGFGAGLVFAGQVIQLP